MTIQSIKKLLKSNNINISDEDIKSRISEMQLDIGNLQENDIARVVDSFISGAVTSSNSISVIDKPISKGLSQRIRKDLDEFEIPLRTFSDKVATDEAMRIYQQNILGIPDKVIAKTSELIEAHQGDPKRCANAGNAIAQSLLADFYAS